MAAERLSGYIENNSNTNGNRDYERSWNGNRAGEVGDHLHGWVSPGRDRARQKDIREMDVVNGRYQSNASRSESGSSSDSAGHRRKRNGYAGAGAVDREPGELSSESVSDGATEFGGHVREMDVKYFENKQSPVMAYKRKFSPIVWDRDEEKASRRNVKTRISPISGSLPLPATQSSKRMSPLPDLDNGVQLSRGRDNKNETPSPGLGKAVLSGPRVSTESESTKGESATQDVQTRRMTSPVIDSLPLSTTQSSKYTSSHPYHDHGVELSHGRYNNTTGPSLGKVNVIHGPHVSSGIGSPRGESPLSPMEEAEQLAEEVRPDSTYGTELVDEDEYVSKRTINASRWANDAESPADEGEILEYKSMTKSTHKRHVAESSEKVGLRKSMTPDFREQKIVMRLSDELRSSGRDGYTDDQNNHDSMNTDVAHDFSGISDDSVNEHDFQEETQEPVVPPTRSVNMLQGCRNVDEFDRLNKIDEGTYGVVYRAKDRKTGEIVALKKVKMEKEREGFPLTSLREINILLSFHHPSIVDVKEVVVGNNLDSIFMVMEYMEHDLKGLIEAMKQPFSQSEVKCLMLQLLEGIKYLHDNWVLHRDLKTSNLLLNNRGELKICDFGLARQYGSPLKPYTHLVVTLWYRAPELLLGSKLYSTAIDMWSLGCIMAELLSKEPLFNGKAEFDQLSKIFKTLGTPNESIWPGFSKLPGVKGNFVKHPLPALGDYGLAFWPRLVIFSDISISCCMLLLTSYLFVYFRYNLLRKKFPATSFTGSPVLSDNGFDLLNRLLTYDPEKRISAADALNHAWFHEVPLPKSKEFMPTFPAQHAQDRRTRRAMKSPDPLEEQRRKELQQAEFGTGGLFG